MKPFQITTRVLLLASCLLTAVSRVHAMKDGFSVLHHFSGGTGDGDGAMNELVGGPDGFLYGTTREGGTAGVGTAFQVNAAGKYSVLHSFTADEGSYPTGALVYRQGRYYGTTEGDTQNGGTIFSFDPNGGFAVNHTFTGYGADSFGPAKSLLLGHDGKIYGVSNIGGDNHRGSLFRFGLPDHLTTLYSFTDSAADGRYPNGSLLQAKSGTFYGSTFEGYGSLFSFDLTGQLTTITRFSGTDYYASRQGYSPGGPLVQGPDGTLYGTLSEGGTHFGGTLFKLAPDGTLTKLHDFGETPEEGEGPRGRLCVDLSGAIYGTTTRGANGHGAIYEYDPDGTLTVLHRFVGSDGDSAEAGLVQGEDNALYGVTRLGGQYGKGTVFRITATPVVTIRAVAPTVQVGEVSGGRFEVTLSRRQAGATVRYEISGSAVNGTDYQRLRGNVKIDPENTSQFIEIIPLGQLGGAAKKTVRLTLLPGKGCTVDGVQSAKIKLLAPPQ